LAVISRAYYWAAAAVQKLNNGDDVDDILTALDSAKVAAKENSYKLLVDLYKLIVVGTKQKV